MIPKASVDQIPNLIEQFQTLSAQKLLTGPTLVGASSLTEMLTVSRLNSDQQTRFAQFYAANRTDMPAFWKAIGEDTIFGATPDERNETVNRLQVYGKLGFLTINNAPLMRALHDKAGGNGITNLLQLAQMGYHRAEPWSQLLTTDVPIPKEIPGETPESKQANYTEYLAAQVRLSYPTAAVAQMVKSGKLPLPGSDESSLPGAVSGVSDQVHAFLTQHQGKFEIGVQPVEKYIAQNNLQVTDEIVQQVKRLQRVYQITPSDQAMIGLMKHGIDAAYHVVRYDKDTFVQSFAADLGGADHAALTYDKSVQVHNAVLNVVLSYLTAHTAPAIGVHSPPSILDPVPANAGDVIPYATLESLFDSMDFCACDHCRSILSPAAYLVDLLQFLDSKPANPTTPVFYTDPVTQKQKHVTPLDILVGNKDAAIVGLRPDIQHLPLTCENTNTALPYIDVVNETLEYFIANNSQKLSLKDYHGYDTNGTESEDLLASPQFVMDSAYTTLRNESFPVPLPFHQPLENLRRYFSKFEVSLPVTMEQLRKTDDLERGANPYGWRDILMEEIGLSRAEYGILTDSTAVPLWRMYGFPNGMTDTGVIAGISNAKQFARRVGITYEDLISILKTRFINPNSDLIPKIGHLGVNFAMLSELKTKNDAQTDKKFDDLLDSLAVPPDPAEYGGDPNAPKNDYTPIRKWVKDNNARIMGLITLTIPADHWVASKAYAVGDCVLSTAPQVESMLYYECTTAGTSGTSKPNWPTTPGDKCKSDGNVDWTCRDAASCISFDNLAFRYSDPAKLTQNINAVEFVRLLRFIRLWKKLGWTIEQTDAAICSLYPSPTPPQTFADTINTVAKLDAGFLILLPCLGIIIRVMKALNLTVKRDLLQLLVCWSEIGTHGNTAIYRQMFLNPALLKQDAVFSDNNFGEFLHDNTEKLLAHAEALRSAFNLTGDEFDLIINDLGFNTFVFVLYTHLQPLLEQSILDAGPGIGYDNQQNRLSYTGLLSAATRDALKSVAGVTANFQAAVDALYLANQAALRPLTLMDISAVFRRGWLARKLKLSVRELLLLIQLTGLDPFAVPDLTNPAILRLIELVQSMKYRSFKSAAALYLIWNQDLSDKSAPDEASITSFARTLRSSFTQIENDFVVVDDPTSEIAHGRMSLVYGNDATEFFLGLLNNALVTEVPYSRNQAPLITRVAYNRNHQVTFLTSVPYKHNKPTLEPEIKNAAVEIDYNNADGTLSFTGELTQVKRDALKSIADTVITDNTAKELFKAAIDSIYEMNSKAITAKLEQQIVNAAPGISCDDSSSQLCFPGALSPAMRKSLGDAASAIVDPNERALFDSAADNLFNESQRVVHTNLEQAIVEAADGLIAYDNFRKVLSYTGILSDEICSALKDAANNSIADSIDKAGFIKAIDDITIDETTIDGKKIAKNLKEKCRNIIDPFFEKYPELQPLCEAYNFFLRLRSSTAFSQPDARLSPEIVAVGQQQIAYDPNAGQLSYKGVISSETCQALKIAAGTIGNASVRDAFVTAVDNLYSVNQNAINNLFVKLKTTSDQKNTPDLSQYKDAYIQANDSPEKQRSVLLKAFLPALIQQRKRQQALQIASSSAQMDLTIATALLDNKVNEQYVLYATGDPEQPALLDLMTIEMPGLSAEFFFSDKISSPLPKADRASDAEGNLAYSSSGNNILPENKTAPGKPISGIWSGFVEAPENALYNLRIEGEKGATVTVLLNGKEITSLQPDNVWTNKDPIELKGGALYSITIKAEAVKNTFRFCWSTAGRGWEVIGARYLYSARFIESLRVAYIRFLKAASLATDLGLTAKEMAYFATHADYRINAQGKIDSKGQGWLNALPSADNLHLTDPIDATIARDLNAALLTPLCAILDFARIKADISPSDESLLTVLKDPATATQNRDSLLFTIARWNQTSLNNVLIQFSGSIAGLGRFSLFRRVYDAFALIQKMGISAKALIQATTNEPTNDTVRDLQSALRGRYDAADWRDVVRPINDEMRSLQRDALVAYILRQMRSHPASERIDTPNKLFEYFLMDVQMDPCMQTSRIRHALSSVQLFIERCLMNLDPSVSPEAIIAKQWEWMKRYRVWEASRKVYLFPENWLEPELRDDKSPFFKEIESELLQSDITEDSAATALLNYLSKLEEVAKLEPCGIYYIPAANRKSEINHVVARTAGVHRKYYYRRYEDGWTPWEQIKLDIEDNPVIPAVWNDRLFLFWLRILKAPIDLENQAVTPPTLNTKGEEPSLAEIKMTNIKNVAKTDAKTNTQMKVQAVLCWSEYYNGKWQATKTSDVNRAADLGSCAITGTNSFDRSMLQLIVDEMPLDEDQKRTTLRVGVTYSGRCLTAFMLFNTHSLPIICDTLESIMRPTLYKAGMPLYKAGTPFLIFYSNFDGMWVPNVTCSVQRLLLKKPTMDYSTIAPSNVYQDTWEAPFFFGDGRHVFFVRGKAELVPIADSDFYGIMLNPYYPQLDIPPLVFPEEQRLRPRPWGDGGSIGPDPGPIQRFVTEDAYIHRAIGITEIMTYGGSQIGPTGAISRAGIKS